MRHLMAASMVLLLICTDLPTQQQRRLIKPSYTNVLHVKTSDNTRLKAILEAAPNETTVYIHDSGKPYDRREDIVLNSKSHLELIYSREARKGKFYNNEILNTVGTAGIRLMGGENIEFYDNRIDGGPIGLDLRKHFKKTSLRPHGLRVRNNRIQNVTVGIAVVACDDIEIESNTIEDFRREAVRLEDVRKAKIWSNLFVSPDHRTLHELIASDGKSAALEIRDNVVKHVDRH